MSKFKNPECKCLKSKIPKYLLSASDTVFRYLVV
jgi:hypothetical protein